MKNLLLLLMVLAAPAHRPAADEQLIILGKVESVHLHRKQFSEDDVIISNACGHYEADLQVTDVIVGGYTERTISIYGMIGEWCDPPIALQPDHYILELRKSPTGYQELAFIPLFDTRDGKLAAFPHWADDIEGCNIESVRFASYHADLYISKAAADEVFWSENDPSWFEEKNDAWFLAKGIRYGTLKQAIAAKGFIQYRPKEN